LRKRNVAILFRLNKKEAEALDKKVKRSGPGSLPETVDFWCCSKRRTAARLLFYDAGAA